HQNVADHVSTTTQTEIDLQGTTQQVCCCAITDRDACGAECAAERSSRLPVNNPARKRVGQTSQKGVPGTYAQQERHNQTNRWIPCNKSDARKENDFGTIQQQVEQYEYDGKQPVANDQGSRM